MAIFQIAPASKPNGEFAAAWFVGDDGLWDDERLRRSEPLLAGWRLPKLRLHRPERGATDVLFNPNALAVSERVRSELGRFQELEFLPIELDRVAIYYALHPLRTCDPPSGCSLRRTDGQRGNLVQVFSFPHGFEPGLAFFRLKQPPDSPAGRANFCFSSLYANADGAAAIATVCAGYLKVTDLTQKSPAPQRADR